MDVRCSVCSDELPEAASVCARCGAATDREYEHCEIRFWRGFVKSQFFAQPMRTGAVDFAIAMSPTFRRRGGVPSPDSEAIRAAHIALVEQLTDDGWEAAGQGAAWYSLRYSRALAPNRGSSAGELLPLGRRQTTQ